MQTIEAKYLDRNVLDQLTGLELELHLQKAQQAISTFHHPRILQELFAIGATHSDQEVRKLIMRHAATLAHSEPGARELVVWLLGDDEDHVVFEAIRLAGRQRIAEAVDELIKISGPASVGLKQSSKPVGVGASLVMKALVQIFGTSDPVHLAELEEAYFRDGTLPPEVLYNDRNRYTDSVLPDMPGMVRIPGG